MPALLVRIWRRNELTLSRYAVDERESDPYAGCYRDIECDEDELINELIEGIFD